MFAVSASEPPDDPIGATRWIDEQRNRANSEPEAGPLRTPINWADLESKEPPRREWVIAEWLGRGHVTLLAGPAGAGKTAIAQTIAAAVSLGHDVIENVPSATNTLLWAGEDDRDELWRRQLAIGQWLGQPLSAFAGKCIVEPCADRDISLCVTVSGTLIQTPALSELRDQIGDYGAGLVFLDSVARLYGGNENDRHQVTQFISWLTWALQPTQAALVVLGHPSKAKDSEWSGSTAWEASVRSRLYFGYRLPDQQKDSEDEPEPEDDIRWLAKRKTNYSSKDTREVRWKDGCMQPAYSAAPISRAGRSLEFLADEAVRVYRTLKEMGLDTGAVKGPNYLPGVAKRQALTSDKLTHRDLMTGLAEAMKTGRLKVGIVGKYANRAPKKGLME